MARLTDNDRKCTRCKEVKSVSMFYIRKERNSYRSKCKQCDNELSREKSKTKDGLISSIYRHQKSASKRRGHIVPSYSIEELREWMLSRSNFEDIYKEWVDGDYNKLLIPSIDRLDDFKGYSLDNIQLVTWKYNKLKQNSDIRLGRSTSGKANCKAVNYNGVEYHSQAEASRKTGIPQQRISRACNDGSNDLWRFV